MNVLICDYYNMNMNVVFPRQSVSITFKTGTRSNTRIKTGTRSSRHMFSRTTQRGAMLAPSSQHPSSVLTEEASPDTSEADPAVRSANG